MAQFGIMVYLAITILATLLLYCILNDKDIMNDHDSEQGVATVSIVVSILWSVYFTYLV